MRPLWGLLTFSLGLFLSLSSAAFCEKPIVIHATDSVFDLEHPALKFKIWKNSKEIPGNQIDDDHNGLIDDLHGWNSADENSKLDFPFPQNYCDDSCRTFFTYRFKKRAQKASPEEIAWSDAALQKDPTLLTRASDFIGLFHGTSTISVALERTTCVQWAANRHTKDEFLISQPPSPPPPMAGERPTVEQLEALAKEISELRVRRYFSADPVLKTSGARVSGHAYFFDGEALSGRLNLAVQEKYNYQLDPLTLKHFEKVMYTQFKAKLRELFLGNPNVLFILPSNNSAENVDLKDYFPMNMKFPNTLVVQASDEFTGPAPFTGYGVQTVDIAVPSVGIYFAVPGESWMWGAATSLSVPVAMNAAARMLEIDPDLTAQEIKTILLTSARKVPSFLAANATSSVLDLDAALKAVIQLKNEALQRHRSR